MAVKVSRILHAGYLLECDETKIAFDPLFENPFSQNCYAYPDVEFNYDEIAKLHLRAVFISHYHDDHCSLESLRRLSRETPIYLYCAVTELFEMIKELGFAEVYALELNQCVEAGSFKVTPRKALNADVDSIFQIEAAGVNILNVVDSWIDDETLEFLITQKPWHMVLWPFQIMREIEVLTPSRAQPADGTLPEEWHRQLSLLNPMLLVPGSCQFIHESWSWYRKAYFGISYRRFAEQLESMQVFRLDPSSSILIKADGFENAAELSWVKRRHSETVDYDYGTEVKAPNTAEITKHFHKLNDSEKKRVLHYCEKEIIDRYKITGPSEDIYFNRERIWQLALYDHEGGVKHFNYLLKESEMSLLPKAEYEIMWHTEIAEAKLHSALEDGESLSSLYMRINDIRFSEAIEAEIGEVDVMQDPLLRCLFGTDAISYQRAQLKRIKHRLQN